MTLTLQLDAYAATFHEETLMDEFWDDFELSCREMRDGHARTRPRVTEILRETGC